MADRFHQEEICQALGLAPEHKYAEHNGPTLTDVFRLVREHGADPARLIRLTQPVVTGVALGNADAHGKNMSLLLRCDGMVDLAPAYDAVPTGLFEDLDRTLAMPIGTATTAS
jgi:serine/threonine-protein kinase HipA